MTTFLFKTEPTEYAFADLIRDRRTSWTGVRNPGALAALRGAAPGDEVFIYHTGDEKRIVGLAEVLTAPVADPQAPPPRLTAEGQIKTPIVDIKAVGAAATPVTLAALKADARFAAFALVRQPRLSVMVVPATLARALKQMSGL